MKARIDLISRFGKTEVTAFVISFLGAYILSPFLLHEPLYPITWDGLDPSWKLAINKINLDGLVWGKDFVFTYGPLAYLSTRVVLGVNKYYFLLYDLFLWFNFMYIFYNMYMRSGNRKMTVFLILSTIVILPAYFGGGHALLLNAFLVYWIRESLDGKHLLSYCMQVILLVLMFFIKFNTGLVAYVFFAAGIFYKLFFTKENKTVQLLYLSGPFLLILVASGLFSISLPDYLKGGLEMVSGYNDIMYVNGPYKAECIFFIVISIAVFFALLQMVFSEKHQLRKKLVICFIFCASYYIVYKQGFVRRDLSHVLQFYQFIPLFILCVRDLHFTTSRYSNSLILIATASLLFFAKRRDPLLINLDQKLNKSEYWDQLMNYSMEMGPDFFKEEGQLPKRIKDKLGQATVDIYPWNGHLLIQNLLNFTPRPVFQSYTAYTPYLETMNFEFYNSDKAPEYVVYENEAIDNRYAIFDEPKVNLVLLKNYTCVDTFRFNQNLMLLLKKKQSPSRITLTKIREYDMDIDELLVPKDSIYYEISITNSFAGKCVSFLHHAPEFDLSITTADGKSTTFKTSKKLLESGIFLDRYCNSTPDFYDLIRGDTLSEKQHITSYGFHMYSPSLFDHRVKIREYKIQ